MKNWWSYLIDDFGVRVTILGEGPNKQPTSYKLWKSDVVMETIYCLKWLELTGNCKDEYR